MIDAEKHKELIDTLNSLIHAIEDMPDNYSVINHYCDKAKEFVPGYSEEAIFTDYGIVAPLKSKDEAR